MNQTLPLSQNVLLGVFFGVGGEFSIKNVGNIFCILVSFLDRMQKESEIAQCIL